MNEVFSYCIYLSSMPDISKCEINNVEDMVGLFFNCSSLSLIQDISKWKTNKLK